MLTVKERKMVATFMGRSPQTDGISWFDENYKVLKYDDWNTVMPVINKISSGHHKVSIVSDGDYEYCEILCYNNGELSKEIQCDGVSLVYATLRAALEFIKWYYENE